MRDLVNTTTFDFPWLTTTEAARIKNVCRDLIRKAIQGKMLEAVRIGKPGRGRALLLIHPDNLKNWNPKSVKKTYLDKMPISPDAVTTEEFRWIDSVEAGERKGLPGRTMQKVLERGELPYVKIGKPGKGRALYLIHEDDLEEWWPKWATSASSPMDVSTKPGKLSRKDSPASLPSSAEDRLLPSLAERDSSEQDEDYVPLVEGEWV